MVLKPNLFIIGAPKCGTTSLMHYLSQHPQIFFSPVKEPHYFNTESGHRYYFNESNYLKLFDEASEQHIYKAEGSVWYLYSKQAVDNILKFNPDSKFIVMLRDPISMFFSLHQELLFGGAETERSAIKAWNLQRERREGNCIPLGCRDPEFLQYGKVCSLGHQLKKLQSKVSKENLKIVLLDDLKKNSNLTFQSILNFLEVENLELKEYAVHNKKKKRKSARLARFFTAYTHAKKKLGIHGGLGIANAINNFNKTENDEKIDVMLNQLAPELTSYFLKDIELMEELLGRDLTHWKTFEH